MSWMQKLYETYENCSEITGVEPQVDEREGAWLPAILLPVGHTLLKAHITVHLDAEGNLLGAQALEDRIGTIAPSTEDSESRSSTMVAPHPLFDKLEYLSGDYGAFTGQDKRKCFEAYLEQLENWCLSPYSHPKIEAIFRYLQKGRLVADLVEKHVLYFDKDGLLLDKWEGDKDMMPDIFKIKNCTPSDAIVRFTVNISGDPENRVWVDRSVHERYLAFTHSRQKKSRLCYVTGNVAPTIEKHPKKVINTLANAKLISTNDDTGFTFRGRFLEGSQAVSVGYDASLKAHNALRWLVDTRGRRFDTKVILAWGTRNEPIPPPTDGSDEIFGADETVTAATRLLEAEGQTDRGYSDRFIAALLSRRYRDLDKHGDVVVMALDCATVGRLSITYYRELKSGEYVEQLKRWHSTCVWLHTGYTKDKQSYSFIGAPSFEDVAMAVYGGRGSEKLKKSAAERLLPCVFDGAKLPDDLVNAAVRRASSPVAMERWEWNKTLSVACALYNKKYEKEGYDVALDETRTDRSYLFGRLLAVADNIEKWALAGEDRETNAMRYMNAFSKKPVETWRVISERLQPYQRRLGRKANKLEELMTGITDKFEPGKFDLKPEESLTGAYLLGFHNQRQVFLDERAERKRKAEEAKLKGQQVNDEEDYEDE